MSRLVDALRGLPERLMVAASGGVDSVALLEALVESGSKPVVVHFDHGWRAESAQDAAFVRELARKRGLKYVGGKARASARKTEAESRAARYAFFAAVGKRLKIADLVLAHQADDQVETFLLQLLRGSGAAGRGMDPVSRRVGLVLHRPWLGIWRAEIRAYAKERKLKWRDDASNRDVRHRRNLLRQRVLPYLRKTISAQVAENLWRAAEIARAEGEWLEALCAEEASPRELEVKKLRGAAVARQRRVVRRWLLERGIADVSFADVEAVRGLAAQVVPAKVNLSEGKFARRRSGKIFVE